MGRHRLAGQEEQVQRLQQRIFKAAQAGDHKRVRNLQKLMLRATVPGASNSALSAIRYDRERRGGW
jgi:RNA-directed DNA polymerase